jgi:hypothetical protein
VLDVHTLLVAFASVQLGFQAMFFGICARIYALQEGLLPEDPPIERALQWFKLETGLAVGALFLLIGVAGIGSTLLEWYRVGFGPLDARVTLRSAIPGVTAICLGGQIILFSFLLSFLGLRRRR